MHNHNCNSGAPSGIHKAFFSLICKLCAFFFGENNLSPFLIASFWAFRIIATLAQLNSGSNEGEIGAANRADNLGGARS